MSAHTPQSHHITLATPCYGGQVTQSFMLSVMGLQQACIARQIGFRLLLNGGDALITRARSLLVTAFMEAPESTHLLFVDSDIGFSPDAVFRLLDFDVDLCGGLYPLKTIHWDQARAAVLAGKDIRSGAFSYVGGSRAPDLLERRGEFGRVNVLGNGFMLIRRRVIEVLEARHPELRYYSLNTTPENYEGSAHRYALFDSMIVDGVYLPEDYAFCHRWRGAGGDIWADLASQLTHQGNYGFVGDTRFMLGA